MFRALIVSLALSALCASVASAATVSGDMVFETSFPTSLKLNALQGDQIRLFQEKKGIVLSSPIAVAGGGTIAAGTRVDVFLIHFDPDYSGQPSVPEAYGGVQFGRDILGLITTTAGLDATDPQFAVSGVDYPTNESAASRGFEVGAYTDVFTLSGGNLNVNFDLYATTGIDQARILVTAVPLPSAAGAGGLALIALLGAGYLRRRRHA